MDDHRDVLVNAAYAAKRLGVSRQTVYFWRDQGWIQAKAMRGRSPLYRWGDLTEVEKQTRRSPYGRPRSRVA